MTIIALLTALAGSPNFDGLATWYGVGDGSGNVFRSGEMFSLTAPVCAVDASLWPELQGKTLLIVSEERAVGLRVADSGNLYAAGKFRESLFSRHFVPVGSPAGVGPELSVVVDIPRGAFVNAFGDAETRRVAVWVVEGVEDAQSDTKRHGRADLRPDPGNDSGCTSRAGGPVAI